MPNLDPDRWDKMMARFQAEAEARFEGGIEVSDEIPNSFAKFLVDKLPMGEADAKQVFEFLQASILAKFIFGEMETLSQVALFFYEMGKEDYIEILRQEGV